MEMARVSTSNVIRAVMDPWREIRRKNLLTANQVVDHYLAILVDGDVPQQVRQNLYNFMVKTDTGNYTFNITQQSSIDTKVRGVIHLILALPEAHIN
jgi:hypothetical protein